MRRSRVKAEGEAFYHIMSRCALQEFLLGGDETKEMFLKMLRRAEYFSGVSVLNYCVMDNHFHLLVKVPQRWEIPDDELDSKIRVLYGESKAKRIFERWKQLREAKAEDAIEKERASFRKRMFDISEFMKTFKQRFSLWYCTNHGNLEGTIWQGPFHSVLVEGSHDALGAISAYITLNPVRAKIVQKPEDYQWSGYGAAFGGDRKSQVALLSEFGSRQTLPAKMNAYREMLEAKLPEGACGSSIQDGSNREESASQGAKSEYADSRRGRSELRFGRSVLHERDRDVSRGVAFGSRDFVKATIFSASNTQVVLTFPKVFCAGNGMGKLYCAGRHRA